MICPPLKQTCGTLYSLCSAGILGSFSSQLDVVSEQQEEQKVSMIFQGNDVAILTCSLAEGQHQWAFFVVKRDAQIIIQPNRGH